MDVRSQELQVPSPRIVVFRLITSLFRESPDDGILTGLLFGPLIASALLYSSIQQAKSATILPHNPLPPSWKMEPPLHLVNPLAPPTALEALILSRYNLINLATFCSMIFLFHVCASWWIEARYRAPESERASVPRSQGRRSWFYLLFTFGVSLGAYCLRVLFAEVGWGIWQRLSFVPLFIYSSMIRSVACRYEPFRAHLWCLLLSVCSIYRHPSSSPWIYARRVGYSFFRWHRFVHGIGQHNYSRGMTEP